MSQDQSRECILIFEDKQENFEQLAAPLEERIDPDDYYIELFDGEESAREDESDSEFVMRLMEEHNYPLLVILDAELNQYTQSTVRKADVKDACTELGVPLCVYHRNEGEYSNPENIKKSEDHIIRLDPKSGHASMAKSCAGIIRGFATIRTTLEEYMTDASPDTLLEPPSKFIEELDDVPVNAKANLDKYSWGQSESVGLIMDGEGKSDMIRRKSTILGYWIYNQLLEYPGVLVNTVAAASYLGVDHETFQEEEAFYEPLEEARYNGPFSDVDNWWWTAEIDGILADHTTPEDGNIITGREFFSREGMEIGPAICLEDHNEAGYYCVLTESPVCEEHSVSPEAWIPAGASLTRISESEYMKLSGW